MDQLEERFHRAMIAIYEMAKRECNYNATYFLQMVVELGGLKAAKRLLAKAAPSEGFATLWECGRLDLSVEAHVLDLDYAPLFTDEERRIARERLLEHGYVDGVG